VGDSLSEEHVGGGHTAMGKEDNWAIGVAVVGVVNIGGLGMSKCGDVDRSRHCESESERVAGGVECD
jgi:hypothetical protein